jgi:hypothetical protein
MSDERYDGLVYYVFVAGMAVLVFLLVLLTSR